jgi:hypothetical protein
MKLRRKNKDEYFKGMTPLLFETMEDKFIDSAQGSYTYGNIAERLDMTQSIPKGIIRSGINHKGYGFLSSSYGGTVISIAVRKDSGDIHIYYNNRYFEANPAHKVHANKFARALGLSLKKDITYISNDLINTWISPFEATLEFYDEDIQAEETKAFFAKMKESYPLPEEENICVEALAC